MLESDFDLALDITYRDIPDTAKGPCLTMPNLDFQQISKDRKGLNREDEELELERALYQFCEENKSGQK